MDASEGLHFASRRRGPFRRPRSFRVRNESRCRYRHARAWVVGSSAFAQACACGWSWRSNVRSVPPSRGHRKTWVRAMGSSGPADVRSRGRRTIRWSRPLPTGMRTCHGRMADGEPAGRSAVVEVGDERRRGRRLTLPVSGQADANRRGEGTGERLRSRP